MKNEFIYSVKDIFTKVLEASGAIKYYVGPYQRGYKWSARSFYDPVPQLLIDVYRAWKKSLQGETDTDKEYYLQYITVLLRKDLEALEVIDGQQRLTTLSIIFDRISQDKSIARGKLDYARYEDDTTLYDKIIKAPVNRDDAETQDEGYIGEAREAIDKFISELIKSNELEGFVEYLSNSVKLILNRESDYVKPEEAFVNLNGNSVALTSAYLIKGLLLTRSVHRYDHIGNSISFTEIMEQRKINGRMWDEIQNWINRKEVARFFFKEDKGIEPLLNMIYDAYASETVEQSDVLRFYKWQLDENNSKRSDEGLILFNKFNEIIQTDKDGLLWMEYLVHAYKKLRTWFENRETYNLLGFVLFTVDDSTRLSTIRELLNMSDAQIKSRLAAIALNRLHDLSKNPDVKYKNKALTPILLSLSVFPEEGEDWPEFDFPAYDEHSWSYEHIRPQNPKAENYKLPDFCVNTISNMCDRERDKVMLNLLSQYAEGSIEKETYLREKVEIKDKYDKLKMEIAAQRLESIDNYPFLYSDLDEIDHLGNMALLSRDVNSSLNNSPFVHKRIEINKKRIEGYFIPKHTLAVFGKNLNVGKNAEQKEFSPDSSCWSDADVQAHAEWIILRNGEVRRYLEKLINSEKK